MLLSLRENGLTSLFKEVRVFKAYLQPEVSHIKTFRRSYRATSARSTPLAPTPPNTSPPPPDLIRTRFWPDSNLNQTRKGRISGPNQVEIRSKSGLNQVWGKVFGGVRGWEGRSGWNGSVAPRKVSTLTFFLHMRGPQLTAVGGNAKRSCARSHWTITTCTPLRLANSHVCQTSYLPPTGTGSIASPARNYYEVRRKDNHRTQIMHTYYRVTRIITIKIQKEVWM